VLHVGEAREVAGGEDVDRDGGPAEDGGHAGVARRRVGHEQFHERRARLGGGLDGADALHQEQAVLRPPLPPGEAREVFEALPGEGHGNGNGSGQDTPRGRLSPSPFPPLRPAPHPLKCFRRFSSAPVIPLERPPRTLIAPASSTIPAPPPMGDSPNPFKRDVRRPAIYQEPTPTFDKDNPFQSMMEQFDTAAELLELDMGLYDYLRSPSRIHITSVPVVMDGGSLKVFEGYHVIHNELLGPS